MLCLYWGAALWGALGGATNALVIKVTALEAVRHIAIGEAIAAGLGSLGAPLVGNWLGLPPETFNAPLAAGGTAAYLTGSLGAAIFEVLLHRIRRGDCLVRIRDPRPEIACPLHALLVRVIMASCVVLVWALMR